MAITVEGKLVGQKRALFTGWEIPIPPENEGQRLTLRALITRIVHEEVGAFKDRQEKRRLENILSSQQIQAGVEKGKVDMGGRDLGQDVDVHVAVDTALVAFEDGFYYVFIDGHQQEKLDQEVFLKSDSLITFVRLVPLAGG